MVEGAGGWVAVAGALSKPVTTLIEKIAAGTGVLYEPTRIVRRAKADRLAARISAESRFEISDLEHRALERFVRSETRKQVIIEDITDKAIRELPETANVDALEEDWVAHFFRQCEMVSDEQMQTLWARLLAGEATNPGSYSKRTVDFVASMDRRDAEIFSRLRQFSWHVGSRIQPIIFDATDPVVVNAGVSYVDLMHLTSIGLLNMEAIGGYQLNVTIGRAGAIYHDVLTYIEPSVAGEKISIPLGMIALSQIGQELAKICDFKPNFDAYDLAVRHWHENGFVVSSVASRFPPEVQSAIRSMAQRVPKHEREPDPPDEKDQGGRLSGT